MLHIYKADGIKKVAYITSFTQYKDCINLINKLKQKTGNNYIVTRVKN
jgi:hypothetical protein